MKRSSLILCLALGLSLSTVSHAAAPSTYQVTGPVLAVTDTMIAVQKGKDRWEIARDANTKVTGDLKVGSKVTITYTMSAASVEVKPDKAAAKTDKAAAKQ